MMSLLTAYKGVDTVFTSIRILTMLTFLAWPIVLFLGIMAFEKSSNGDKALVLLALAYPILFGLIVHLAEKYLVSVNYPLAVFVALIPLLTVAAGTIYFYARPSNIKRYEVKLEGKNFSVGYGLRSFQDGSVAKGPEHEPIPVLLISEPINEDYVLKDRDTFGFTDEDLKAMPNEVEIKVKEYKWGFHYSWMTPTIGSAAYHYVQRNDKSYGFRLGPVQGTRISDINFYWDLAEY